MAELIDLFNHTDGGAEKEFEKTKYMLVFMWRSAVHNFQLIGPHYSSPGEVTFNLKTLDIEAFNMIGKRQEIHTITCR
jgi:hypothetical protein